MTLIIFSGIVILFLLLLMASINYEFRSCIKIKVNAPVEAAFKLAFDDKVMKQWLSSPQLDFVGLENIRGFKNEVGSQWKMVFSSKKGNRLEMLETITAFEDNKKMYFELADPFFKFHVKMDFDESNGKTTITEELKGKSANHFFNAMMRIFGRKSIKTKREQYKKLKDIIEETYNSKSRSEIEVNITDEAIK